MVNYNLIQSSKIFREHFLGNNGSLNFETLLTVVYLTKNIFEKQTNKNVVKGVLMWEWVKGGIRHVYSCG